VGEGGGIPFIVVRRHCFGVGKVESYAPGDTQLVDGDIGVPRDDRAGRKVDALPHEIPPNPPLLPLQPLADRLDGPAKSLAAQSQMQRSWTTLWMRHECYDPALKLQGVILVQVKF
jgi:hypothetical protein